MELQVTRYLTRVCRLKYTTHGCSHPKSISNAAALEPVLVCEWSEMRLLVGHQHLYAGRLYADFRLARLAKLQ